MYLTFHEIPKFDCFADYKFWLSNCHWVQSTVSWALQNILSKFVNCRNPIALGTHTKFQLEILIINVITDIVYFREIILESLRNVSETHTPYSLTISCIDIFSLIQETLFQMVQ